MVYTGELHVEQLLRKSVFTFVQAGASCKWVDDSQRLVLEHFDTISNSPSQIYHSALPLCPSSSWLYKHYTTELLQEVKVTKGHPAGWGKCFRTVTLDHEPLALTCWKDTIAVGFDSGEIITLDGITGIQTAILSGHTDYVKSLVFFPDGTLLVSGSYDKTIKLWDVQTGGIVKTFHGHTNYVHSVSVSADCTLVASGSDDYTICLWNVQAEECHHVIEQQNPVVHVRFSPTDPQHLLSVSNDEVWHWNINGHQTNPTHNGTKIAFSLDGTQFVSCNVEDIVVQNSSSGEIVAKFHMAGRTIHDCCFSPDGRLIATATGLTIHVWDTTSSHPHPVETFDGHTNPINTLEFHSPSSLISSDDNLVKLWEVGTLQADQVVADLESASIMSITLQAEDSIAISSDSDGVVRIWDISTGLCKASFETIAKGPWWSDVWLINSRLIYVWYMEEKIHILDVEKGELLHTVHVTLGYAVVEDVKISGDGSNIFCLWDQSIQAWSIHTGEAIGEVGLEDCQTRRFLTVDSSRVWVHSPGSEPLGWDFGTPGSPPVQLSNQPLLLSKNAKLWDMRHRIKDAVNKKVVFQLAGRYVNPVESQWDGRYLVAGYESGEVLILDFNHVHS